ncbi:helix-turn-helix transcriptional regulator [Dyadobacter arcticus]|uniref:Transcriptional regulator with XRE-family HTH domain n=1 Tax=Dyadobacter arcticus TaxID=1078754 RepID=A0ABX0UPE3_9BACT|nr:helix-turn-helix transcriptional regulator [Dyadobacter arcticus]NIJ53999.1 transcriptional regulator with XRE-family HTH domain [Dyadobacter arcticus]
MSITGQRIRKYRELMGWNQETLAKNIEKASKQTISHWETGRHDPSLSEVRKLAEVLNTTVAQLVGEAPMFEEPRENYIMVKKDDLIELQRKALDAEEERVKSLTEQLEKALGSDENEATELSQPDITSE